VNQLQSSVYVCSSLCQLWFINRLLFVNCLLYNIDYNNYITYSRIHLTNRL